MTFKLFKAVSRSTTTTTVMADHEHGEHGEHGGESHAGHHRNKPVPFLASPVDPEALLWLERKKQASKGLDRATTIAQFEAESSTESQLANRIFRKQHEASSLELFFDLFFVGNLAIFTTKSAHVDLQCE